MSSANLALVRSILADWERGEWRSTRWAHPEIEFVIPDGPEPGSVKGLAGMSGVTQGILSSWEGVRSLADQFRKLDDERVLVFAHRTGRATASGLEVTDAMRSEGAWLFHVGDGRVFRLITYWDRDRALADLGLTPEGDPG
jgi:ketosteroid isomerase-like protein